MSEVQGFKLGETKVVGNEATAKRDVFVTLLLKNGFRQIENDGSGYKSFQFKENDWLFVKAFKDKYVVYLQWDVYKVKSKEYDDESQRAERFLLNNILRNL